MAVVRRFALGLVPANKAKGSVKTRRKSASWDPAFLLEILQLTCVNLDSVPCRDPGTCGRRGLSVTSVAINTPLHLGICSPLRDPRLKELSHQNFWQSDRAQNLLSTSNAVQVAMHPQRRRLRDGFTLKGGRNANVLARLYVRFYGSNSRRPLRSSG
jgi:hypothetical protein